jgi:hypothetical protein
MNTSPRRLSGGCECGAVRYEVAGQPYHRTLCHCATCRRTSGAPMVGWFSVRADEFRLAGDEPRRHRSSAEAERSFCGRCGTPLTFRRDGFDEIDVTICSLDDAELVPPDDQTFARSMLRWTGTAHLLPKHAGLREEAA